MNEVEKVRRVSPFVTGIIYFEPAIWRTSIQLLAWTVVADFEDKH